MRTSETTHVQPNARIEHRVRIDGRAGPWIVFSNSLGCTLEMWDQQVAALSGDFRIFRYDTRGHGGTPATEPPYTLELLADDILDLLTQQGIEGFTFVGLSMGGMIGQVAALRSSERFTRLVLADTTSRYGPEVAEFWARRGETALAAGLSGIAATTPLRWFTPDYVRANPATVTRYQQMLESTDPAGYAGCCAAIPTIDVTGALTKLKVPTLVIVGAQDPSTTPAHARAIANALPDAELVEIDDAAHLSNVQRPHAFNDALIDFLHRRSEL